MTTAKIVYTVGNSWVLGDFIDHQESDNLIIVIRFDSYFGDLNIYGPIPFCRSLSSKSALKNKIFAKSL